MATDEQIAEALASQPQSLVSAPSDFIARIPRGVGAGASEFLQQLAELQGNQEIAQKEKQFQSELNTPSRGDLLPTNPDLDNTFLAGLGTGIGRGGLDAAIAAIPVAGLPLVLGKGAAATAAGNELQQQQYKEALDRGETPPAPDSPGYAQLKGALTQIPLMLGGRFLAPFANPAIAAAPQVLRPILGVGTHTAANLAGDVAARVGFNALEGKPLTPFESPADFGSSVGAAGAFGFQGGIHQANAIPAWIKNRDLARAKQLQDEAIAKAAETQTVSPNKPAPENIEIKPATEESTGIAFEPAKQADPVTPTAALPHELQLNPNSALAVEQTSTKEPQVVVTPKKESTETKAEPATPTVLEPADRLKVIDEEMEKIREESGVGDDGQLSIASPETQATFDALAAERMKLALGEEPTKGPQPVTGLERPKVENAPPPFTSEEAAPEVAFPETQKPAKVTQADVTEVVKPEEQVRAESDLTKLSDDELETQESIARQTNDQSTLDRIDTEIARRAALGETPIAEERPAGVQDQVAENAQRGAGVPGDEAVTGERGPEPIRKQVEGLTPEESAEYWDLVDKRKLTESDTNRLDALTDRIPAPANLRPDAPKSSAALLIRRGRANGLELANRIREDAKSAFADLGSHLADRFKDSLGSMKVVYDRELEGAFYDPKTHTMTIGEKLLDDQTISHELIHGITNIEVTNALHAAGMDVRAVGLDYIKGLRKAQSNPDLPKPMRDLLGQYFHALDTFDVDKKVTGQGSIANRAAEFTGADRGVHYGLLSVDEFLSEAFTSREFQNLLNRIPDPRGGTVWTRVVDAVAKILGMKPDQKSLLTAVIKSGLEVGDLQSVGHSEARAEARHVPTSKPNEEDRPYIDRGQPANKPLEPGMESKDNALSPSKEIAPEGTGPIGESPDVAARRFAPEPDETGNNRGRPDLAGGPVGQPAQPEKPKTAFERIGDFLKQNKYVARAIHRFSPSIMDARDNYTRIIDGQDAVSARAAGKARDTLIRALPKKEDQDAANIVLASGGGRIGEGPSEAERLNLDSMTKHRDDLLDQFERAKDPEEQKTLKQQIDDLSEGIARFDADPQTVEGVTKKIQDQINKGKLALENPEIPEDRKAAIRKWMPVFERAAESVERLSPASKLAKREYDDAYMIRHPLDPTGRYYQDYAGRIYEYNESRGNSPAPPASLIGGSYGGTKFNKSRFYPTVMDAMIGHSVEGGGWEGESPKSLNLPDLVANHVKSSNDFVGGEAVKERLQTEQYPDTNEPVILPDLKPGQKPPANYVKVAGPRGEDVWVYHPVADLFKSVWAPDAIKNTDIGKGLTKAAGVLKHGTVAYDVFHPSRLIQIGAFEALADGKFREAANRIGEYIKNVVKPGVLTGEHGQMGKFLSLFNVDARDLGRYVKDGTITQETADYLRGEGKTDLKQMTEGGLRPQLFTDNLWKDAEPFLRKVTDKIGLGTGKLIDAQTQLNKATFDRLAPAMMAAVFKWRRAALEKSHPELTQVQLSRRAATETNERFGNLGKSGPIKSATAQSFANIISLAPMWQISQAAAEARQFGQLGKAAIEAAWGKTMPNGQRERVFRLGNSAKFLATTAATIFALNQAVNMATRGHPTWQNPEDDHKFDAWIPGGKNGFFYSPTTLVAEYSHHYKNYRQFESPIGALAHIAANKLSPMGQAAKVALTQKNYKGEKLSTAGTIGEVAKSLTPIPISLGSAAQPLNPMASPSKSGQLGLNIARTFGIGLDRAPDAVAIGYQKFAPYRTKDRPETGPSVYRDLKTLVQNDASPADIKKEVERLKTKEGKKLEDIRKSFDFKNLAGSYANDLRAIREKPELKKVLEAAKAQKKAEADAFRKALQSK